LDHAVYVSGVNHVTIQGCVGENAAREGILVENADNVDVADNEAKNNDRAMAATVGKGSPPCPTFVSPGTPGTGAIQMRSAADPAPFPRIMMTAAKASICAA
jgi:parallel beta-helix repeat protein